MWSIDIGVINSDLLLPHPMKQFLYTEWFLFISYFIIATNSNTSEKANLVSLARKQKILL
jgi:hypothetical protein